MEGGYRKNCLKQSYIRHTNGALLVLFVVKMNLFSDVQLLAAVLAFFCKLTSFSEGKAMISILIEVLF